MPRDQVAEKPEEASSPEAEERSWPVLAGRVPTELHTAARVQAAKERRPVSRLLEDAVRRYLETVAEEVPA